MSNSKRHHTTPCLILRNFADSDEKFFVFDKRRSNDGVVGDSIYSRFVRIGDENAPRYSRMVPPNETLRPNLVDAACTSSGQLFLVARKPGAPAGEKKLSLYFDVDKVSPIYVQPVPNDVKSWELTDGETLPKKIELPPNLSDEIQALVEQIASRDVARIEVRGYADGSGDPSDNLRLSKERARSVAEKLEQALKIIGQRVQISHEGYGERPPVNDDSRNQLNRVVEIWVFERSRSAIDERNLQ